jgi:hypothetical protein
VSWKFHARTIREDKSVEDALNDLSHKNPRFEEAYEALTWLLARSRDKIPKQVRKVDGIEYNLYVQAKNPIAHTPRIRVIFTYTEDLLHIIAVDAG